MIVSYEMQANIEQYEACRPGRSLSGGLAMRGFVVFVCMLGLFCVELYKGKV